MLLTSTNLLARTNCGLQIYQYILREYFPGKDLKRHLQKKLPLPNPFVVAGQLLIEWDGQTYRHRDLQLPAFKGNALDLAGHHFRTASNHELYFLLNQNLKLGLKIPPLELLEQLEKAEKGPDLPGFSYFEPPISNTRPAEVLNLPQLYRRIIGSDYAKVTEEFRRLTDPKEARQFKAKNFPYVTFGGRFEKRGDQYLQEPSGLMVIDLDDLPEVSPVREALIAEPAYETELLFVSPSGNGLKWVTSYAHRQIGHLDYFRLLCSYLEAVFGLTPDPSGKDISRACFIAEDKNAFIHRKYLL